MNLKRSARNTIVLIGLLGMISFIGLTALPQTSPQSDTQTDENFEGKKVVARQVIVKFNSQATTPSVNEALQDADTEAIEAVGGAGAYLIRSHTKDATTLVKYLSARRDITYAEPNYILYANATPNDPQFGQLWGLQNTGQSILGTTGKAGADVGAVPAWDISTGSPANVVAVVDTGIDYTHPDLAANVWSAPADFSVIIGGTAINCAKGTHGFNAITKSCDPMDDNDHGTHVSGTIGAVGNNGTGVVGVNWTASIMGSKFLNARGSGTTSNAINAIEFTIQAKAALGGGANVRVLSNSWAGGGFSQSLLDEINRANTNNMLFVAAAGNSGYNNDTTSNYPSNYDAPNVVAVAATDNTDSLAWFSNYGKNTVDLGAPGVNVLSTVRGNSYAYFSGTSMATPHVSGAAALVLSSCSSLTAADLKNNLLANVDPISSLVGITVTGGRLNANKSIRACATPPAPDFSMSGNPTSLTLTQGGSGTSAITVTSLNGFSGSVSLAVTGCPTEASCSLSSSSVTPTGTSTLSVSTTASTNPGPYTLTVTGTSGSLVHSTTLSLTVNPAASDFTISASPSSLSVDRGSSGQYTVTIGPSTGSAPVNLSVSGLPPRTNARFNPNPASSPGSSTLTVTVNRKAASGTDATLTITGNNGSKTNSATVNLHIN